MSNENNTMVDAVAGKMETLPESIPVSAPIPAVPKKRPTAAESLAKQKAQDAANKVAKKNPKKGSGRLTPENRVRKSTKGGTTVKPAKKTPVKSDTESKGAPKKEGLRTMQLRALKVLEASAATDAANGLTMEQLAKKAGISPQVMKRGIGAVNPENREAHDQRERFKSLLSRGMVKVGSDEERGNVYYLGALGEKATEKNADDIKELGKKRDNGYYKQGDKIKRNKRKAVK